MAQLGNVFDISQFNFHAVKGRAAANPIVVQCPGHVWLAAARAACFAPALRSLGQHGSRCCSRATGAGAARSSLPGKPGQVGRRGCSLGHQSHWCHWCHWCHWSLEPLVLGRMTGAAGRGCRDRSCGNLAKLGLQSGAGSLCIPYSVATCWSRGPPDPLGMG